MDYLAPSIQAKVATTATEDISAFEVQMYSILESANKLEKQEILKATQIRNLITDLMKELTNYKANLRKSENDQKDYLINRLEDLQENLANFEHNFSTKFQIHKGLGEAAVDRFRMKQVTDDMFEL